MNEMFYFACIIVASIAFCAFLYFDHRKYVRMKEKFLKDVECFKLAAECSSKFDEIMQYFDYLDNKDIITEDDMATLAVHRKEYDELAYKHKVTLESLESK